MDFKPSPERQILFDTLKKYFENEYSLADRNIAAHSDLGYSKKAWEAMRDLGILESLIEPELDGFGGTALLDVVRAILLGSPTLRTHHSIAD